MEFCEYCENIVEPKVDPTTNRLVLKCSKCIGQSKPAKNPCVYVNQLSLQASDDVSAVIHKSLALDPGLPSTKSVRCPKCKQKSAKWLCPYESKMVVYFLCTNCHHYWGRDEQSARGDDDDEDEEADEKEGGMDNDEEAAGSAEGGGSDSGEAF